MTADQKSWLQLALALVGFATLAGGMVGAVYGAARETAAALSAHCLDDC